MTVHRYLFTSDLGTRMDAWSVTAPYANWIEGRENGTSETWLVACFDEQSEHFLAVAQKVGATVQEIEGAEDDEQYLLRVGDAARGWPPDTATSALLTEALEEKRARETGCDGFHEPGQCPYGTCA